MWERHEVANALHEKGLVPDVVKYPDPRFKQGLRVLVTSVGASGREGGIYHEGRCLYVRLREGERCDVYAAIHLIAGWFGVE